MIIKHVCPVCHKVWLEKEATFADRKGSDILTICCPTHHAQRQAAIEDLESRYPSAKELGLVGSKTEPPAIRMVRPGSSGRRVIRKGEIMGG